MISVCMATYNGEEWVAQQLRSVLSDIGAADEIVVVDDASDDATVARIEELNDPRISIWRNSTNMGHVASFERALSLSSREFILLADQDDIWVTGRALSMVAALKTHEVVASNYALLDEDEELPPPSLRLTEGGHWFRLMNILGIFLGRRPYYGCAMGMRRSAMRLVLPFPPGTEAHDLWIALVANVHGRMRHMEETTVLRRIHLGNLTPARRRGWLPVLRTRGILVFQVVVAMARKLRS